MSSIALQGGATGSGVVSLLAPSTSTNRTLTLPDATGTVLTSATTTGFPAGSVLQVVSTTKTDTFSSSSFTYVDITGLSVSVTPTSATSKIYVVVTINFCSESGGRLAFQLVRGSTAIGIGDAAGNRTRGTSSNGPSGPATMESSSFSFLDSPSTTSATTYKVQLCGIDTTSTYFVNRTVNDEDITGRPRTVSTITVMEIAA